LTAAGGLAASLEVETPSSPPTKPAIGQSLAAWTVTSTAKVAIAAAINTVPETAPAR
jgi:hypothetical protein